MKTLVTGTVDFISFYLAKKVFKASICIANLNKLKKECMKDMGFMYFKGVYL